MNYDSKMMPAGDTLASDSEPDAMVDAHSIRAREDERVQLRADIEAFLAQGGKVTTLEANHRADLPKVPQNNYGKGSI